MAIEAPVCRYLPPRGRPAFSSVLLRSSFPLRCGASELLAPCLRSERGSRGVHHDFTRRTSNERDGDMKAYVHMIAAVAAASLALAATTGAASPQSSHAPTRYVSSVTSKLPVNGVPLTTAQAVNQALASADRTGPLSRTRAAAERPAEVLRDRVTLVQLPVPRHLEHRSGFGVFRGLPSTAPL